MEFLYIDESGDNGFAQGSTKFFTLAGISIEDRHWKEFFWLLKGLKQEINQKYGIQFDEIKGSHLFTHRGPFYNSLVNSPDELAWIYDRYIDLICHPLTNLFVLTQSKEEFKRNYQFTSSENLIKLFNEKIWLEYLSMYETHLHKKSVKTITDVVGMVYSDNSGQAKYIRRIVKQFAMRFDHNSGIGIVEDVIFRDSATSYFIQLSDILAFSMNKIFAGKKDTDMIVISNDIINKLKLKIPNLFYLHK